MIGVFDSGVGGLTVVRALMHLLPGCPIVYLGDTARTPYGTKSAQTIIQYSLNNTRFLIRQGAQAIVIACNTASSYAYEALNRRYSLPVFEVIGPGARLAVDRSRRARIGVMATRATVASGVYEKKIKQYQPEANVFTTACPLLVPLVEEGWINKPETAMIIRKYLQPLKAGRIDTLVLGCTHYPVLNSIIQRKIGRQVVLVESAEAIAQQVGRKLKSVIKENSGTDHVDNCRIFVTDTAVQFRKTARMILGRPVCIEQADLC